MISVFGPASARSYKIDVVSNNWLVGNAVFSETALRIFLIFCIQLGDYKGRKVAEPVFEKNSWFGDIRENDSKLAQNQTLWYLVGWLVDNAVFPETALRIFLIFWLKLGDYKGRKVTKPDICFLTIRRSSQCILVQTSKVNRYIKLLFLTWYFKKHFWSLKQWIDLLKTKNVYMWLWGLTYLPFMFAYWCKKSFDLKS